MCRGRSRYDVSFNLRGNFAIEFITHYIRQSFTQANFDQGITRDDILALGRTKEKRFGSICSYARYIPTRESHSALIGYKTTVLLPSVNKIFTYVVS
jgi:hypothetical protein